jgi:hypothetical protein
MSISDDPVSVEDNIRPFEWLTNASSLKPLLGDILPSSHSPKRALHVGCGSSTLGEYLVQELDYDQVVNVDKDGPTLRQMEHRWRQQQHDDERLTFCEVDLVHQQIPYPSGYFDLAIDKSTLDCTLCSDEATAALLCQVYRCLNAERGAYVVISFHHIDLLLPLLRDCPGTDWHVSHHVIRREVEDVVGNTTASNKSAPEKKSNFPSPDETKEESAWATGSFEPGEEYRTTVNVLICKQNGNDDSIDELDRDQVRHHVHQTNDEWFQSHNPMLTRTRQDELQKAFQNRSLDLQTCYVVLFTEAEREHLTYEHFLEDWEVFRETSSKIDVDRMTFDTAVAFLKEMQ